MKTFLLLFTVVLTANCAVIPDIRSAEALQYLQALAAPLLQSFAGNSGLTRGAPLPFTREQVTGFFRKLASTDEVKELTTYFRNHNVDARSLIDLQHDFQQEFSAALPVSSNASPQDLARTLSNINPVDLKNIHDTVVAKIAANPSYSRAVASIHDPEFQRIVGNILDLDLVKSAAEVIQSEAFNSIP